MFEEPAIALQWATPADLDELKLHASEYRLPVGGLLIVEGTETWLGFRPVEEGCELTASAGRSAPGLELAERVLAQARKSRYRRARMANGAPEGLAEALRGLGFEGEPLSRALVCDAPAALQPYLDWRGRVTQVAFGKGSETINVQLYARVAAQLPDVGRFTEVEINKILNELHTYGDQSGLRRELVDRGFLARTRDCREYWKSPTRA